jgi:glutaredoxin
MSAERKLKQRPVLVLFYMDGCPHCKTNEKAWKEAKKKYGGNTAEIESAEVPPSTGVTSFPTMKYISEGGQESTISGAQTSGDEILQKLNVPSSGGRRRRRATRRTNNRRNRKLRHRTLRNHVTLV